MNVAFLTTSFPRYPGDYAGAFVFELAKTLSERGFHIHVLAPHARGSPKNEEMDGIKITRFKYFWPSKYQSLAYGSGIPTNLRNSWIARLQVLPFALSFLIKAWWIIKNCDIIHAHWIEPGLIGLLGKKLFGRPLVDCPPL